MVARAGEEGRCEHRCVYLSFVNLTPSNEVAEDYDYGVLHQYMQLLPDMPLARMIEAYFGYMGIVLEEDDDEEPARSKPAEEDVYDHVEIMMVRARVLIVYACCLMISWTGCFLQSQ